MTTPIQPRRSPPNQNAVWKLRLRGVNKMMEPQNKTSPVGLSNDIFLSRDKRCLSAHNQRRDRAIGQSRARPRSNISVVGRTENPVCCSGENRSSDRGERVDLLAHTRGQPAVDPRPVASVLVKRKTLITSSASHRSWPLPI